MLNTTALIDRTARRTPDDWVDRYLTRIGAVHPTGASDQALKYLHRRHLLTVPFENLSVHLGEEIVLEPTPLIDKVVRRHRGGFCYELNGAFGALLTELGYEVDILAARVHTRQGLGPPYDHMALRVGPWLADVGFGTGHSQYPLRWDHSEEQRDPAGTFRVETTSEGDLDVLHDGRPIYRLWTRPVAMSDFMTGLWWHTTLPSHFGRAVICSLTTVDGRLSLSDGRLIRTVGTAPAEQRLLVTDEEVLEAYRVHFGLALDRVPRSRWTETGATPERIGADAKPERTGGGMA